MRDDEFNYIKITNEGENPGFEYGATPSSESTSYSDNGNRFRDEVNDNPHSNNTNKKQQKEKKRKQENYIQYRFYDFFRKKFTFN